MKYYAEFYAPGTFVSETKEVEIKDPNNYGDIIKIGKALEFRYSAKAYCFRTYSKDSKGKRINNSNRIFFGIKIRTIQDVIKDNLPNEQILRDNMINNNMNRIAEPIEGWKTSIALSDDDIII